MIRIIHRGRALWSIASDRFSPALRDVARDTPGMTWNAATMSWDGYVDAVEVVARRLTTERELRIDAGDLDGVTADDYSHALPSKVADLRDYQKIGVDFLVAQGPYGALLADDLGLGKSAMALRAARTFRKPTLVVCPAFVQSVWLEEAAKWWPEASVRLLGGVKATPLDTATDITICNYSILYAWAELLKGFIRVVVWDEAHYLTGAAKSEFRPKGSRRSAASAELAEVATVRIGLTGTPLTNRPRDLHNLINTLSPGRFGKFFQFGIRHCDGRREEVAKDKTVWLFDGASNLDELNQRLKWFMLRRTKADVALELPPKIRQTIIVDVKSTYRATAHNVMGSDKAIRAHLAAAANGKLADVVDLVRSHVADGRKVVVFAYRRAVVEALVESLIACGITACRFIHGGVPQKKRDSIIAAGHAGDVAVLGATIDVTAGGISLAFADVGVFAELTYEPHELIQAEGRLHRYDARHQSRGSVVIQYVLARGSIDELIATAVVSKLDVFEKAIGSTGEGLQKALQAEKKKTTDEQLRSLYERLLAS